MSLSHVALAFPPDDPLYGQGPPPNRELVFLGDLAFTGERGLLRLPAEWLLRRGHCRLVPAMVFGLLLVMGIAAAYEIVEWWYAVLAAGDAGIEFLGSQGDIWDAQKDMLADTLGAVFSLLLFAFVRPDKAYRSPA